MNAALLASRSEGSAERQDPGAPGRRPCLLGVGFPLPGFRDRTCIYMLTSNLNAMPGAPAPCGFARGGPPAGAPGDE